MVSPVDDALLVKYLGYDSNWSEEVQEYIDMAKEKLPNDCFLTPRDTIDIKENGKAIRVIEPQDYSSVSTIDATNFMFNGKSDDDNCSGYFYEFDDKAVSGSGADVWYKVTPSLVEFCRQLDCEVASFTSDDVDLDGLKGVMERATKDIGDLEKEEERHRVIAVALRVARKAKQEEALEIRHKMGAILAGKRKRD